MKITLLALSLSAITFAGCAAEDLGPVSAGNPIINGETADEAHHASVVSLHYGGRDDIFCTGTLIAPDVVLTAGHCLDDARGGKRYRTMSPSLLTVYFGDDPTDGSYAGNNIQASDTLIHPSYSRQALTDDIALVRLASDAPAAPLGYLGSAGSPGLSGADIGSTLDFVGFGWSDLARTKIDVKLHALDTLDAFGCQVAGCGSWGDDALVVATQFSYAQTDVGPCNGDSGGPAFILRDGSYQVAGITSYGDADCAVYGASTRVGAYGAWIDDYVNTSPPTCDPSPEVCDDGVDNDCDGDTDSADSDCDTGGTCELGQVGDSCSTDADCCSSKCKGRGSKRSCR